MLAKKKKLSKKQIKEDKLVTSYYQVLKFYDEYQSKILMAAGALVVIIVAVVLYTARVNEQNLAATTELSRIIDLYTTGDYQKAIDGEPGTNLMGLKDIVENYDGTEQGELAQIYLANCYFFLSNFDKSFENYDGYSGNNDFYKATSLAGKAAYYEVMNDREEAADLYLSAAKVNPTNPSNAEYYLNAGINYLKTGDNKSAEDALTTLKNDYETSIYAKEADKYLSQIN